MAEQTSPQAARQKIWTLIREFQAAMLVTRNGAGQLSARPMSPVVEDDEGLIYILTEKNTETVRALAADPKALLTFADGTRFISLSAQAQLSEDRGLIERIWNPGAQAFWPEGPRDPKICAVVLTPADAEYWDGNASVITAAKMLVANLTGTRPDPGEHGAARL